MDQKTKKYRRYFCYLDLFLVLTVNKFLKDFSACANHNGITQVTQAKFVIIAK